MRKVTSGKDCIIAVVNESGLLVEDGLIVVGVGIIVSIQVGGDVPGGCCIGCGDSA